MFDGKSALAVRLPCSEYIDEVDISVFSLGSEFVAVSPGVFAEESTVVVDLFGTPEAANVVILLVFMVVGKNV